MESVDKKIKDNNLQEQIVIYSQDNKLLIKTSENFNDSSSSKQIQILSNVVDTLLKSNRTDTLFTVNLNETGEVNLKVFDNFTVLSLESQSGILFNLAQMLRKLADIKKNEQINTSEYIN